MHYLALFSDANIEYHFHIPCQNVCLKRILLEWSKISILQYYRFTALETALMNCFSVHRTIGIFGIETSQPPALSIKRDPQITWRPRPIRGAKPNGRTFLGGATGHEQETAADKRVWELLIGLKFNEKFVLHPVQKDRWYLSSKS